MRASRCEKLLVHPNTHWPKIKKKIKHAVCEDKLTKLTSARYFDR